MAELTKYRIPVYLFGIDEKNETGYFMHANRLSTKVNLNGIPTMYPVSATNIELLWKEVSDYWNDNNEMTKFVSHFNL